MFLEESGESSQNDLKGIKIAKVISNEDAKMQERVLVRVIGTHNMAVDTMDNAVWANHCSPFRDASGDLPEPGDFVYVMFPDEKDPMSILWIGFVRSSFQPDVVTSAILASNL